MPPSTNNRNLTSFTDRNDYITRLSNLPIPGANSRVVHRNNNNNNNVTDTASLILGSSSPLVTTTNSPSSPISLDDPFLVTKQWNAALTAAKFFDLHQTNNNNQRKIVSLKLSLIPSAPSTSLDISLPPISTGGEVDLFWPSETSIVDESTLQLPKVPPLKISSSSIPVNSLIQQQWIPLISSSLKSSVMKLHRYVALKGGIQNKKWAFEAGSFLASIPENEWDIVVEKSEVINQNNSNTIYGSQQTRSATSSPGFGMVGSSDVMRFISSATSAFEGYVFPRNNNNNNNNQNNNNISSSPAFGYNSNPSSIPTMAVHLKLELFSKSRSHELRTRLLSAISKIMKHATEQLKGGEIREQLDSLCTRSQSNSQFMPSANPGSKNGNDIDDNDGTDNGNNKNNSIDKSNTMLSSSKFYDIKSDFSCIIHVSESISSEYQFAAIQNQQVFFDVVDVYCSSFATPGSEEKNEQDQAQVPSASTIVSSSHDKFKFIRHQALQMLNQIICEELFPSSSSSANSRRSSPLPRANKDDFSFYDYVPALENTIVSCIEKIANWCSFLYGFSITFGSPLWSRTRIPQNNNGRIIMDSQIDNIHAEHVNKIVVCRPPVFSNCVTFLFDTPRSSGGPIISLFVQVTLKSHQNHNDDNDSNSTVNSFDSQISPTVNIISSQLERNGQPLMFSWVPSADNHDGNNNNNNNDKNYEAMAGAVLQYLVDSIPKLQGLYRSMLHHQQQHQQHQKH